MLPEIHDLILYCLCELSSGFTYGIWNINWRRNGNAAVIGLMPAEVIYCCLYHAAVCITPISKTLLWVIFTVFTWVVCNSGFGHESQQCINTFPLNSSLIHARRVLVPHFISRPLLNIFLTSLNVQTQCAESVTFG